MFMLYEKLPFSYGRHELYVSNLNFELNLNNFQTVDIMYIFSQLFKKLGLNEFKFVKGKLYN